MTSPGSHTPAMAATVATPSVHTKLPFAFHGQDAFWVRPAGETLQLRMATDASAQLKGVFVRLEPDNEEHRVPMELESTSNRLNYWVATVPCNRDRAQTHYAFKILLPDRQIWLDARGMWPRIPGRETHFCYCSSTPPTWIYSQIFYQIFPDRFCNGKDSLSVREGEYTYLGAAVSRREWGALPRSDDEHRCSEFFGGDLVGVRQKLDYIQDLGITALYLNPIFTSPSNHKYDTVDYLSIDKHLGGEEALLALRAETKERGMKLVLDAVLNHTSSHHPFMDRYGEHGTEGAYGNPASLYREFYFFQGDDYVSWLGYHSLPKLNLANAKVQEYFWLGDQAVVKKYLQKPYDIDGWRFDVIHMLGEGDTARNNKLYVQQLRTAVKHARADAWFLGEHFYEATAWLQGDLEDGAMNYYGFAHPVRAFLAQQDLIFEPVHVTGKEMAAWLREARGKIPWANVLSQLNLLDSHDTPRFLWLLKGNKALMRLGVGLLMTYPGVPCIYYGDEVGLEGGPDPDCRRCFPWHDEGSWDQDLLGYYRTMTGLRRAWPVLQTGAMLDLDAGRDTYAFARFLKGEHVVIVALNRNPHQTAQITALVWHLGLPEEGSLQQVDLSPSAPSRAPGREAAADGVRHTGEISYRDGTLKLSVPPASLLVFEYRF